MTWTTTARQAILKQEVKCRWCGTMFFRVGTHQFLCGSQKGKTGCSYKRRQLQQAQHRGDRGDSGKRWLKQQYKQKQCEVCGFLPKVPSQLDINHRDGNRKNNTVENYQTVCANCHRLITWENKHWENTYPKSQ
mgnify:CR=1 FL=1